MRLSPSHDLNHEGAKDTSGISFALFVSLWFIFLLAIALRFGGAAWDERFHADEAWFASFARDAAVHGDWMLTRSDGGALDKPPLVIYAMALSMQFTAVTAHNGILDIDIYGGEWAARLPSAFAGVVTVAAVYALAWRLYRRRGVALIAAGFAALSPYGIVYSAAAFTDGLMAMFMALAWACAAGGTHRAALWSGVFVALAFACKPQGLYAVPLCLVLLWKFHQAIPLRDRIHSGFVLLPLSTWIGGRFALSLLIGIALIFAWDSARTAALEARGLPAVSMFAQAAVNNDPERASIRADEIAPRFAVWIRFAVSLIGTPAPIFALAIPLSILIRRRGLDALLLAFVVGYFALHWLLPFNLYDRYLLPLLPLVSILAARGALWIREALTRFIPSAEVTLLLGAIGLALINGAFNIRNGNPDIGAAAESRRGVQLDPAEGRGRSNEGIDAVADFLNTRSLGAIIYDRWLGWELGYYMGAWTDKRRVYYPTPDDLARGAAEQPDPAPRYFVAPLDAPYQAYLDALASVGFESEIVFERAAFRVYEIGRLIR